MLERIRENDNATPTTTAQTYAATTFPSLPENHTVVLDSAAVLPSEDQVGYWFGSVFQSVPGASITPQALRLLEKYIEDVQK